VGSPLARSASIVRNVPSDANDPGKLKVRWNPIKASPDDHEGFVDQVVQVKVALNPASQKVGNRWRVGSEEATQSVLCFSWHVNQCALWIHQYQQFSITMEEPVGVS
jgi:hypothetical protein